MSNRPNRTTASKRRVEAARKQSGGGRTVWIVVGVVVVVLLAAVIAVAVSQSEEPAPGGVASPSGGTVVPSGDLDYGEPSVDGTPLASLPRGGSDPAAGQPVPEITSVTFDGSSLTIPSGAGKPKVIMALAHWCPHCQAEVPRIQDWLDENGMPDDVDLYAIATGTSSSRPNYPPGDWLREEGWSVPTLLDDQSGTAGQAIGLSSYPFFVVVDAAGDVVFRTSGELTVEMWEQVLDAARTGTSGAPSGGGESSPVG